MSEADDLSELQSRSLPPESSLSISVYESVALKVLTQWFGSNGENK